MKVDIVEQPPLRLYAIRYEGPVTGIGEIWSRLWAWAVQHGLTEKIDLAVGACCAAPDAQGRAVYYAGVSLRQKPELGEGVALREEAEPGEDVGILELDGGLYACSRLIGPYSGIAGAFQKLFGEWLPASGYEPDRRPALEIYRNNPYDTPESELITDLLVAVRLPGEA
jgi:AraC family transcriptional regulator